MGNFQKGGSRGGFRGGSRGGDRGGRGGFGGGRGGDRGPVTMHDAICDSCKKACEVPFRPTGEKPVYCSDCFGGSRGDDRGGRRDSNVRAPRRDFDRPAPQNNEDLKRQISEIGTKIDQLTNTVEKLLKSKSAESAPKEDFVVVAKEKAAKKPATLKSVVKKVVAKKKK